MNNSLPYYPHDIPHVVNTSPSGREFYCYFPSFSGDSEQHQYLPSNPPERHDSPPNPPNVVQYLSEPERWSTPPRPASARPHVPYSSRQVTHSIGSTSTPSSASWNASTPASSRGPLTPSTSHQHQPNSPFIHVKQTGYPYPIPTTNSPSSNTVFHGYDRTASISPGRGAEGHGMGAAWTALGRWGSGGVSGMESKRKKDKKRNHYPPTYPSAGNSSTQTAATYPERHLHQSQGEQWPYPLQAYPAPNPPSSSSQTLVAYPPSHAFSTMGHSLSSTSIPAYAKSDEYTAKNLAKRPLDWRADYEPKSRAPYLLRLTKNQSEVQEYSDSIRRTLHPLLLHTNPPPIYFDLRDNPLEPETLEFPNLQRPHNDLDFAQLATTPPASVLRLYHPRLPWYIDIHQTHCNGVTVFDIITQMFAQLMTQIQGRHYWNDVLNDEDRNAIVEAYSARCDGDEEEIGRGVLQVDFLGKKVVFEGLARGRNGMWEIKTGKEKYLGD